MMSASTSDLIVVVVILYIIIAIFLNRKTPGFSVVQALLFIPIFLSLFIFLLGGVIGLLLLGWKFLIDSV